MVSDSYLCKRFALIIQGVVKNVNKYLINSQTELDTLVLDPVDNKQMRANLKQADVGLNVNDDLNYSPIIIAGKVCDYCVSELAIIVIFPEDAYSLKDFAKKHCYKPILQMYLIRNQLKKLLWI